MPVPIRPTVSQLAPYSPGKPIAEVRRELGLEEIVKLASNENPLGPSPLAVAAVQAAATTLHLYPDAAAHELRQKLAAHFDIPADQIVLGNGSDELIQLLGQAVLSGPDDEVVMGDPSFVRYDAVPTLAGSQRRKIKLHEDGTYDLDAMAAAVNEHTKLVWIANPNNPTGCYVSRTDLEKFLTKLPPHVLTVLDEAYFEYARSEPDYPDSRDLVRAGRPVVGLRTFSKAYGLAGIRLGYGFAPIEIADAIGRIREPFNCNSLAQVAAIAALDDDAFLRETVATNRAGRDRLVEAAHRWGARPLASAANFVCIDFGKPARPLFEELLLKGMIVRPGDVLGLPNCLRISVGTPDEVDRLIDALESLVKLKATL